MPNWKARSWPSNGVFDMANYIQSVNELIMQKMETIPEAVLFGQNCNNGTFISGLTKNIRCHETSRIMNNPNVENSLCAMGFGMMMAGTSSVYFVKQLDFMLLGIDHFVNTYNFIRCSRNLNELGSFSIIMFVCDQGMQGPQSSFNNYAEFSSIARVPCYSITNSQDAPRILETTTQPGFRMIGLSSRHSKTDFLDLEHINSTEDLAVLQYSEGADATIVCFHFSLAEGLKLKDSLAEKGINASVFSANYVPDADWSMIKQSVANTGKLVVMDDSKSVNIPAHKLLDSCYADGLQFKRVLVTRPDDLSFGVDPENFEVDYDGVIAQLTS